MKKESKKKTNFSKLRMFTLSCFQKVLVSFDSFLCFIANAINTLNWPFFGFAHREGSSCNLAQMEIHALPGIGNMRPTAKILKTSTLICCCSLCRFLDVRKEIKLERIHLEFLLQVSNTVFLSLKRKCFLNDFLHLLLNCW